MGRQDMPRGKRIQTQNERGLKALDARGLHVRFQAEPRYLCLGFREGSFRIRIAPQHFAGKDQSRPNLSRAHPGEHRWQPIQPLLWAWVGDCHQDKISFAEFPLLTPLSPGGEAFGCRLKVRNAYAIPHRPNR